MSKSVFSVMSCVFCGYVTGWLHGMTNELAFGLSSLIFIIAAGALTFVAEQAGIYTGVETEGDKLTIDQLEDYIAFNGIPDDVNVWIGGEKLHPAGSLYHAILDGERALIIERKEEK